MKMNTMKMNKMKKYPVVQLMPLNMLLEIEVEVEIVVIMMSIIWGIDYYKGGQVEAEAILHRQARQVVLKLHQKENDLNDYTFIKSCLINGLG